MIIVFSLEIIKNKKGSKNISWREIQVIKH